MWKGFYVAEPMRAVYDGAMEVGPGWSAYPFPRMGDSLVQQDILHLMKLEAALY
jgi:hypothetical protein